MRSTIMPVFCNFAPWVALTCCASLFLHRDVSAVAATPVSPMTGAPLELTEPDGDYIRWLDASGATLGYETAFEVVPHLDIKPGDCPNPLKTYATEFAVSRVPASIIGNAFDVTQVDLGSVQMTVAGIPLDGGPSIAPYHFAYVDNGTPFLEGKEQCDCHTLNGDTELDLLMDFNRLQMVDEFELDELEIGVSVELRVTGTFLGGKGEFSIRDCVRIQGLPE